MKAHVLGPVDELEDRRGRLVEVLVLRLDAQDARIAAGTVEVAGAERREELGEVSEGFLNIIRC